jgi:hypothetical protein
VPIRIELSKPQFAFVNAVERFPAMVAGFGAGKTFAGVSRAICAESRVSAVLDGYYLPTYDLGEARRLRGRARILDAMEIRCIGS